MFRLLAALAFAASAAAAAQDCEVDSSAPHCAAKSQNQLLQASKRQKAEEILQTDVSSSVSPMLEMVEGFAQLVGQEGRNLTSSQKQLIRKLNATFYNETLPTIVNRHTNDVKLLKTHVSSIEQCSTDLGNNSLVAASSKNSYDQASSASNLCAGQEAAASNASTRASRAMTSFLTSANPPSSTMPAVKGPTPEMDTWVQTNLAFYKSFNRSYYAIKATMTAAKAAHSTKTGECQTKATAAAELIMLYNKTLATAMSNVKGRKADYSALMKVECYLKVLLADDGMAASALAACENSAGPDLTALNIVAPPIPARAEAALAGLGAPVDKSCHLYRNDTDDSLYGA